MLGIIFNVNVFPGGAEVLVNKRVRLDLFVDQRSILAGPQKRDFI